MKKILKHLKDNWIRHGFETLVVINGILIAYGLNNWNQERKEQRNEVEYLQRLKNDLSSDNENLSELIEFHKLKMSLISKYFEFYQSNPKDFTALKDSVLKVPLSYARYFPVDNTHQELINSGDLNLLDEELRVQLVNLAGSKEFYQIKNDKILYDIKNQLLEVTKYWPNISFLEQEILLDLTIGTLSEKNHIDGLRHYHQVINIHNGWAQSMISDYNYLIGQNTILIQQIDLQLLQ